MMSALTLIYKNCFGFALEKNVNTLVVGNSHPQCAINDSLFGNCKNLSRAGEPFFYLQFKLEKVLSENPQIDQVIIEISDNEFKSQIEEWIYNPMVVESSVKSYWAYWPLSFHKKLFSRIGIRYFKYLVLGQKKYLISMLGQSESFFQSLTWGGFKKSTAVFNEQLINEAEENVKMTCDSALNPMPDNLLALKKIQSLCSQYGKEIIFIRCPVHTSMHDCFELEYEKMIKENVKTKVLDFRNWPMDASDFADKDHLNRSGAYKFTRMLKDTLY